MKSATSDKKTTINLADVEIPRRLQSRESLGKSDAYLPTRT